MSKSEKESVSKTLGVAGGVGGAASWRSALYRLLVQQPVYRPWELHNSWISLVSASLTR